ncbi:MAG TPA: hypothetical protein VN255_14900 [Mycobacterium sp.]|nr:hypothetical protein [Mycobacterium sp.]
MANKTTPRAGGGHGILMKPPMGFFGALAQADSTDQRDSIGSGLNDALLYGPIQKICVAFGDQGRALCRAQPRIKVALGPELVDHHPLARVELVGWLHGHPDITGRSLNRPAQTAQPALKPPVFVGIYSP